MGDGDDGGDGENKPLLLLLSRDFYVGLIGGGSLLAELVSFFPFISYTFPHQSTMRYDEMMLKIPYRSL